LNINFENLIVRLYFLYNLNAHVKFRPNWILFNIRSINLFLIYNFIPQKLVFKHLIDELAIEL